MCEDQIHRPVVSSTLAIAVVALPLGVSAQKSSAQGFPGAVYTLSNQSSGNSVIVFDRAADGTPTFAGSFPTGGSGAAFGRY
jgi:6-phosphogluconolactonase